jgi:hypothetical protein
MALLGFLSLAWSGESSGCGNWCDTDSVIGYDVGVDRDDGLTYGEGKIA